MWPEEKGGLAEDGISPLARLRGRKPREGTTRFVRQQDAVDNLDYAIGLIDAGNCHRDNAALFIDLFPLGRALGRTSDFLSCRKILKHHQQRGSGFDPPRSPVMGEESGKLPKLVRKASVQLTLKDSTWIGVILQPDPLPFRVRSVVPVV